MVNHSTKILTENSRKKPLVISVIGHLSERSDEVLHNLTQDVSHLLSQQSHVVQITHPVALRDFTCATVITAYHPILSRTITDNIFLA